MLRQVLKVGKTPAEHAIDIERTLQMIDLVLHDASVPSNCVLRSRRAVLVNILHPNSL